MEKKIEGSLYVKESATWGGISDTALIPNVLKLSVQI